MTYNILRTYIFYNVLDKCVNHIYKAIFIKLLVMLKDKKYKNIIEMVCRSQNKEYDEEYVQVKWNS